MEMGRKPPPLLVRPTVLHEPHRCIRAGGSLARQKVALTKARSAVEMLGSAHGVLPTLQRPSGRACGRTPRVVGEGPGERLLIDLGARRDSVSAMSIAAATSLGQAA
jgi:hypothetical protein